MSEIATQIVSHPIDTSKAMLLPPPETTDPFVKSLYYAQDAEIAIALTKGVKSGVVKLTGAERVSQKVLQKLGYNTLKKVAYNSLRKVGEANTKGLVGTAIKTVAKRAVTKAADKAAKEALKDAAETLAKKEGIKIAEATARTSAAAAGEKIADKVAMEALEKAAVKAAEKAGIKTTEVLGRMAATQAALAPFVPIGEVVDAVLITAQVFGLVYELFDKSGMSMVMGPGDVNNAIKQIVENADANMTKAGVPNYYSDPAEFPIEDLIFQWDPKTNSFTTTPEWGPMYSGLLDEYMKTQGFGKDWRDHVESTPMLQHQDSSASSSSTSPSPKLVLIVLVAFLCVLAVIGGLFFIMSS